MASDPLGTADLLADALDLTPTETSNLRNAAPFVSMLPAVPSSNGTTHKYPVETGAPVVGYRSVNAGRDTDSSIDTVTTVNLAVLDWSFYVDQALAAVWRRGGKAAVLAREANRHLRSALFAYEQQIFYGTTSPGDSGGFSGLGNSTAYDGASDAMVVDATGTTATTGSSVWAIRIGPDDFQAVYNSDEIVNVDQMPTSTYMTDGSGKLFPIWWVGACTWNAIQIGGTYSAVRIANLTEDSGKGLTDALLAKALEKFKPNQGPTVFVMNKRSQRQLRASRTATNPTGAPAPFPDEAFGVPILITDAITSTETLLS